MNLRLLDTDHISILRRGGANALRIEMRLSSVSEDEVVTCIVTYEEQMRGWMAEIARIQNGAQLIVPYESSRRLSLSIAPCTVLPFDQRAAALFDDLKRQRVRIGTQDLKIAAIAIANDAIVITRNTQDFSRVPNLKLEDWSV